MRATSATCSVVVTGISWTGAGSFIPRAYLVDQRLPGAGPETMTPRQLDELRPGHGAGQRAAMFERKQRIPATMQHRQRNLELRQFASPFLATAGEEMVGAMGIAARAVEVPLDQRACAGFVEFLGRHGEHAAEVQHVV